MPLKPYSCPECLEFQKNSGIDAEHFLQELTEVKRKTSERKTTTLSFKEVEYICLSLNRYSVGQITYFFHKSRPKIETVEKVGEWERLDRASRNLKSDMSKTVHKYIIEYMRTTRFPGWDRVLERVKVEFRQHDYERQSSKPIPEVEASEKRIKISITIKNNKNVTEDEILNALKQLGYTTLSLEIDNDNDEKT